MKSLIFMSIFVFFIEICVCRAAEPRRFSEQRWLIDSTIATVGVDWSWPISRVALGTTTSSIHPELMGAIKLIKKYADISRTFAGIAGKCEALAKKAEAGDHLVTAREYYFSAANLYAAAQWPIHEDDNENLLWLSKRKNTCYGKYAEYAAHSIEKVEIAFEKDFLPGYLHFPKVRRGKIPCVIVFDGMDSWKEAMSKMYGDEFLERGMAVLILDGPGQGEAAIRKIKCTANNFPLAGKAAVDFLMKRPEIDPEKIAVCGVSMGSFWVTQIAAYEHRLKAAAVAMVCHEPGMETLFNKASPTFKARYMWMAGYEDEDEFDKFAETLSLKGQGAKIKCPVLIMAGEDDELSPIKFTYKLYEEIKTPKKLVVFEGQPHFPSGTIRYEFADWIQDRFKGIPFESEIINVPVR